MKTGKAFPSKYLKASDLPDDEDVVVTISIVEYKNVGQEEAPESRLVAHIVEFDKGFVINKTNCKRLEKVFDSDETDDWEGKPITLYIDPDVSYGGKITPALRVRSKAPSKDAKRYNGVPF